MFIIVKSESSQKWKTGCFTINSEPEFFCKIIIKKWEISKKTISIFDANCLIFKYVLKLIFSLAKSVESKTSF